MTNHLNALLLILTIAYNVECGLVKTAYDTVKTNAQAYSDVISDWFTSSFDKIFDDTKEYKMEEIGENPESRAVQNDDVDVGREIVKNAYNGLRTSISLVGEQVLGDNNTEPNGEKKGLVTNIFDKIENLTILAKDKIVEEAKILQEKTKLIGVGLTSLIFPDRGKYRNKNKTEVIEFPESIKQTTTETTLQSNLEKSHLPSPETSFQPYPDERSNSKLIFQPEPELPQWAKLDLSSQMHAAFPQISHQTVSDTPVQFDPEKPYLTKSYLSALSNPEISGSQPKLDLPQWAQTDIPLAPYPEILESARPKIPFQLGTELQQTNPAMLFQPSVHSLSYPAMPSDIRENSYQLFNPKIFLRKHSHVFNDSTELELSNQTEIPTNSAMPPITITSVLSKTTVMSKTTSMSSKTSSVSSKTSSVSYTTSSLLSSTTSSLLSSTTSSVSSPTTKTSSVSSTTSSLLSSTTSSVSSPTTKTSSVSSLTTKTSSVSFPTTGLPYKSTSRPTVTTACAT